MAMNDLSPIANLHLIMDNKLKAKFLYWLGWKIVDIAEVLNENERTVQAWKTRDDWEKERMESCWFAACEWQKQKDAEIADYYDDKRDANMADIIAKRIREQGKDNG